MNFVFNRQQITGVLSIIPKKCVRFEDEIDNYGFSKEKCISLQKTIGLIERRIVEDGECGSDLALFGLEYLFRKGLLSKDEIGAIVVVTQSPDHFMPPTSCILQGKLGLHWDVICFDINQGCTGYLYGLLQAFMLVETFAENKKVIVINCDTLSRKTCQYDRNVRPMIGDAAAITIVEKCDAGNTIQINLKTDGARGDWLMIPGGGFRMPSTEETRKIVELPDGNKRSADDFYMNGAGVFTFTQTDVAASISEFLQKTNTSMEDIDYFLFHQPNRFMLERLGKKLSIPSEKMPTNVVEKFGNSSGATIPVAICLNIADIVTSRKVSVCMAGFGSGLAWGTLTMSLGPLQFCELIEK